MRTHSRFERTRSTETEKENQQTQSHDKMCSRVLRDAAIVIAEKTAALIGTSNQKEETMDQQPQAVVETPKRRFALRLPSRSTLTKVGAAAVLFTTGVVVGVRKTKANCACETDSPEQSDTDN